MFFKDVSPWNVTEDLYTKEWCHRELRFLLSNINEVVGEQPLKAIWKKSAKTTSLGTIFFFFFVFFFESTVVKGI